MINPTDIARIRDAANIVDVVQDYISLTKRGTNYVACCPFHDERTPSFNVSPSKNIFKCFGCGKGGSAIDFVMEHEHVSYAEALRILARKYHIEIVEKELTPQQVQQNNDRESMMALTAFAAQWFADMLSNTTDGKAIAQSYLAQRSISLHVAQQYGLGYSPADRNAFVQASTKAGYKEEFLLKTGLCYQQKDGTLADRFAGRIMFPIHSIGGRVIGFGGRTMSADKSIAKYVNSPESDIYHKSATLYGIFFAKKAIVQSSKCYLVEGYTDVLALHAAGIENVAASSGTSLTTEQIKLLKRFTENITILYDGDAAGIKASMRGIDMLLEEGMKVRTLLLPDGEDPDSFAKSRTAAELSDYITANEEDFIRFKIKVLLHDAGNDPLRRAAAAANIIHSIAIISDALTRSAYVAECAKLIGMDEASLMQECAKVRRKRYFEGTNRTNSSTNNVRETEDGATAASGGIDIVDSSATIQSVPAAMQDAMLHLCCGQEREIVYHLLKHGDLPLFESSTADYIIRQIEDDGIILRSPDYAAVYEEYKRLHAENSNVDSQEFINHEDQVVRRIAADILTTKYTTSRIWDTKSTTTQPEEAVLSVTIPKLIHAYKARIVELTIREKTKQLEQLLADSTEENSSDTEENQELSTQIVALDSIRNEISRLLNRVMP